MHEIGAPFYLVGGARRSFEAPQVLFGATLLGTLSLHNWLARVALRANNRRGYFDNLGDTEEGLRTILAESFATVDISMAGSVALFTATRPRG
ncbi:MAG TPA: hypothetical protein QGF05_10605 [Dehalococcoidia bacterium]|nr:hypothetical protein [Dehalococcoidia bacterium]